MEVPQPSPSESRKRSFPCVYCRKAIYIPMRLPPTEAPCPHCGETVTSPPFEEYEASVPIASPKSVPDIAGDPLPPARPTEEIHAQRRKKLSRMPLMALIVVTLTFIPVLLVAVFFPERLRKPDFFSAMRVDRVAAATMKDKLYRERGWQAEAVALLEAFQSADTIEERASMTVGGDSNIPDMEAHYAKFSFIESDTPVSGFSPVMLPETDTQRGIFLMNYNRPEQYDIRQFFRPLPPLRVEYGLEETSLMLKAESGIGSFVSEPVRVMAYFHKSENQELLLDWHVYRQTKCRLFRSFLEAAQPGESALFRVYIEQDKESGGGNPGGSTVFRISDPAFSDDHIKVLIKDDSPLGQAFAPLTDGAPGGRRALKEGATVELEWSQGPNPQLRMKNFLCWEFLNLGGKLDNWR